MFLDNAAATLIALCFRAAVGILLLHRVFGRLVYVLSGDLKGNVYLHWVRGALNPADPPSRLCSDCDNDELEALELASASADTVGHANSNYVFLLTAGLPLGPFVPPPPRAWRSKILPASHPEGSEYHEKLRASDPQGSEWHDFFLVYRVNTEVLVISERWPLHLYHLCALSPCSSFSVCREAMPSRRRGSKGKRKRRPRALKRNHALATINRHCAGKRLQLQRKLRTVRNGLPVRRVYLGHQARIYFGVAVSTRQAPNVL